MIGLIRDELGLQVVERSIDRTELYTCDELFLCGTGAQVSPVVEVDRRTVGDGAGRHADAAPAGAATSAPCGARSRAIATGLTPVYG